MQKVGKNFIIWLFSIILTILGFILGEGWIIGTVLWLGFWKSFLLLSLAFILINSVLLSLVGTKSNFGAKINRWMETKEKSLNPKLKSLLKGGKIIGFLFASVSIGPVLTALISTSLKAKSPYFLAAVSSLVFSLVWAGIYSGLIETVKLIFKL